MQLTQLQVDEIKRDIAKLNHDIINIMAVLLYAESNVNKDFLRAVVDNMRKLSAEIKDLESPPD